MPNIYGQFVAALSEIGLFEGAHLQSCLQMLTSLQHLDLAPVKVILHNCALRQ